VLTVDGIRFNMGGSADNQFNMVRCTGQKLSLPKTGNFNKIYILAAAASDTTAIFRLGGQKKTLKIQAVTGHVGQFENRRWDELDRIVSLDPGFIKQDEVAWYATHLHNDTSNIPYRFAYIFKYELDGGPGSEFLQLPDNESVMIFAITLAENPFGQLAPVQPLYDLFSSRERMVLKTGNRYVAVGMKPSADVTGYRKRKLEDLPAKVTMKDYADIHMPNGVTVSYLSSSDTPGQLLPAPSLNDGMFELLPDDSAKDAWSMAGEGRILMDLQRETEIDSLHLFAVSEMSRGPQRFSLWGKTSGIPDVTGDPRTTGWSFIATAAPMEIWGDAKAVYRVTSVSLNKFRYLMWISEDSGYGPYYFREIDIFEKQH